MSWGVSPWVYPVWDSLGFLDLDGYFLPHFREVFIYYLLRYFLMAFLSSSSGTPMMRMLGHLTLSQRSLRFSLLLLILFSFFLHHSIFHLTYPIFCCSYSTVSSLQSALISVIALFIIDWLFFISSTSLLNFSCIFSIFVSRLSVTSFCFQDFGCFLLSLFWILFQIDSLSPSLLFGFVGFYHFPLLAGYFSTFSFCLVCCVWGPLSAG